MSRYSVIGRRIPRLDGVAKATGQAEYVHDLSLPHMLHAKVLRSPVPHARILNIDTSKARRLSGVKGIITGKEIEPVIYGFAPISKDETALAIGKVRYIGEEVAAVAAVDEDTAMEALELIHVDYEELPAYFTPEEAMAPGSVLIHEGKERNIGAISSGEFGDVQKALRESDYVREDCFSTQIVCHCQMEPHGALASYDTAGKLTVWAPKQMPYFLQRNLARTLNMPENKIRVIKPHMGGGFGGKGDMYACDFCASLLAIKTNRPVKLIYSREEVFTTTRTRHAMKITIKTGCRRDGSLLVKDCQILADNGAYNSTSPLALYLNGALLSLPFRLRNFRYEGKAVYTNKLVAGAMRGHGYLQMRYAADVQLDLIAKELGIDPVEIRLKNAIEAGYSTPNGFKVNSCALTQSIEKAVETIGWKEKKERLSPYRGIGMGCSAFISGCRMVPYNSSAAFIKLHEDGGITLIVSEADIGQGSDSVLAMIAAEELGIAVENINVVAADTEITPNSPGTFGSRVTITGGKAVQAAAADVKKQLFEIVAKQLEADPEDLVAKGGKVFVKGSPDRGMPMGRAVKYGQYYDRGRCIMGKGYYNPDLNLLDYQKGSGNLSEAYSFGSHCAEVEIDPETGLVKLLEVVSTHDCGVPINPMAVEGQNEGSISIGQGQVLYEELLLDRGLALNPSFLEYKLPTSLDSPSMKTIHLESHDPIGPYGAKESGEGVILSTIPAIANAIGNALGRIIPSLPITPEKVLEMIEG